MIDVRFWNILNGIYIYVYETDKRNYIFSLLGSL